MAFRLFFGNVSQAAGVSLSPAAANLVLSPTAPSIAVSGGVSVSPAAADLALSTAAPSRVTDERRDPAQGNLSLSPPAPIVVETTNVAAAPATANLVLSGAAPSVAQTTSVNASPAPANLALSSVAPSVTQDIRRDPAASDLTLSTAAPAVALDIRRDPAAGNLVLTTVAPGVAQTEHRIIVPAAADLVLSPTAPTLTIRQYAQPDADVSDGGWTNELGGAELFSSIDEATANDNDYIQSSPNPSDDACRIRLSDPGALPAAPFDVMYRFKREGEGTINLTVTLFQGGTQIAQWVHNGISASFVDASQTLTGGEFAAITDFNDLSVEFMADAA